MTTSPNLNQAARLRIDRYLDEVDQVLARTGKTREERRSVTDDLETQILEMLSRTGVVDPTLADIESVLARMDPPHAYGESGRSQAGTSSSGTQWQSPPLASSSVPDFTWHRNMVGLLHIIWGLVGLLGAMVASLFFGAFSILAQINDAPPLPFRILTLGLPVLVLGLSFIFSLPGIFGGFGLRRGREWARILLILVAVFELFSFPIGTALGIYTLWALWDRPAVSTRQTA